MSCRSSPLLRALRGVTVCDLACGSGAYLLGMLHELLDLRTCLFAANQKLDAHTAHERKLEIIERNLYGVDKDAFAVNIARLRLWLSLAVEYDGSHPPPALPNLDFKIEQGDTLAAPAPADVLREAGDLPLLLPTVRDFSAKKARYLTAHGTQKDALRIEIAELKKSLKTWLATEGPADAFHWALEFAEVFIPTPAAASLAGGLNLGIELAAAPTPGGFDIVVANPPYVRMELIKPQKPVLRRRFPHVHAERADLYVYFFARAHQLLRDGGTAAFISSNKWLRAGYGEALRQHLLDAQAFSVVMDFSELGVFEAATDTAIFIWKKESRGNTETRWAMVKDLDRCFAEGVRAHFLRLASQVPAEQFGKGKPRLATTATADLRTRMQRAGPPLKEVYGDRLGYGIKTGLNEAFIISAETRDRLCAKLNAADVIKPLVFGDDIRRYEVHFRHQYLIYTYHGSDMAQYEAVLDYLDAFRELPPKANGKPRGLEHRATKQEWWELQQPQKAYEHIFAAPKILYPDIGKEPRFVFDACGYYPETTGFAIGVADFFLLSVLNSSSAWTFFKQECLALGDRDEGGRLRLKTQYVENLPIPTANITARSELSDLAKQAQDLHGKRRTRTERFLRDVGMDPAKSTSRNPLEQPWLLSPIEFGKRTKPLQRVAREAPRRLYEAARDETAALTEQITKLKAEIDARVAALYGLDVEDQRWAASHTSGVRAIHVLLDYRRPSRRQVAGQFPLDFLCAYGDGALLFGEAVLVSTAVDKEEIRACRATRGVLPAPRKTRSCRKARPLRFAPIAAARVARPDCAVRTHPRPRETMTKEPDTPAGTADEIREQLPTLAAAVGAPLPGDGRTLPSLAMKQPLAPLCREIAHCLHGTLLFRRGESLVTVDEKTGETMPMTPTRFRSWHQRAFVFHEGEGDKRRTVNAREDLARAILASDELRAGLRELRGVNLLRLPVWRGDGTARTLDLLPVGYDADTKTFTISRLDYRRDWTLDDARAWFFVTFGTFPFFEEGELFARRSFAAHVAAMLGVFTVNLLPAGAVRPLIVVNGNQPGLGKTLIVHAQLAPVHGEVEDDAKPKSDEELRNVLDAAALAGAPYLVLDDAANLHSHDLNRFVTSPVHVPRVKGQSVRVRCPNVTQVFATGNGLNLTADLDRRALVVDLFDPRAPDERTVQDPLTNAAVFSDAYRASACAALWAILRHWRDTGLPACPAARKASFEAYADLVGSVVVAAGFANAFARRECVSGGDEAGRALQTAVCRMAGALHDHDEITVDEILDRLREDGTLDVVLPFECRDERKALGHKLRKLRGREYVDARGRRFEFGRRDTAAGSRYVVTFTSTSSA